MSELYPSIGAQAAIRALVHQHVNNMDAKIKAEVEELATAIDLEDVDD